MALSKLPKELTEIVTKLRTMSVDEIKEMFAGKEIGAGSFKVVYDLGSYVLKVSEEETDEIKNEIRIKSCGGDKFLTKIYAYDEIGYAWLVSEKVRALSSIRDTASFIDYLKAELDGSDFLNIEQWVEGYDGEEEKVTNYELEGEKFLYTFLDYLKSQKTYPTGKYSPWLKSLMSLIKRCDINPGDLVVRNWGRRLNGDFVILDYGFTKKF